MDLYRAYKDARRHKRGRDYQLRFEYHLEDNLVALRDALYARSYHPLPATCFVVHDPKLREVFAAAFRDRIVHHLFYNYTHVLFERTFIADSYSCIKGRGIHYGISRLRQHLRSVSAGYSAPAYVLHIDIRGYFMHIDRAILLALCRDTLAKMRRRLSPDKTRRWGEIIDYSFVDYLLATIINSDPLLSCRRLGDEHDWDCLPADKSIFFSGEGCGLPIGNLTSQLFSNVYFNPFDHFMKRQLHCRHYGRYVDDFYVVANDRAWLRALVPPIRAFLQTNLHLDLNERKLTISDVHHGVTFLGAHLLPFRTYISSRTLRRIRNKVMHLSPSAPLKIESKVNSFLGALSHFKTFRLRRVLFGYSSRLHTIGRFSPDWRRYRLQGH